MVIGTLPEPLLHLISGDDAKRLRASKVLTRDIEIAKQAGSKGVVSGMSIVYMKWLIAPPPLSNGSGGDKGERERGLPEGYCFDKVRREEGEFRLVISRTEIPRTEESLGRMGCVGIRHDSQLIAWAFLGVDGSLTSLHVEPAHRGKGLAKAVSRKLLKQLAEDPGAVGFRPLPAALGGGEEGMGKGEGWADSDVAVDNLEGAGVARGLGGERGWEVRWVGVDLGRVREVVRGGWGGDEGGGSPGGKEEGVDEV